MVAHGGCLLALKNSVPANDSSFFFLLSFPQHKPPAWIQMLQDLWIVLPRRHHAVHHRPPFDKYYCITSGHLNAFLDGIGFWRRVEVIINTVFGAVPRQDDDLWTSQIYGEKKK